MTALKDPSRAIHPQKAYGALARVLQVISEAEHPITSASIWRYSDIGSESGFGWKVVESPPVTVHGTDKSRVTTQTNWENLAGELIRDIVRLRAVDLGIETKEK